MIFQRFKSEGLAQLSYLLADEAGDAVVVDPRRDIDEYLDFARRNDLTLRFILETHRQEDFVTGSLALAAATGARIAHGSHPNFRYGDLKLQDGQELGLAGMRLRALHTPGHTLESFSYVVLLDSLGEELPWGVFTGDALFAGSTGRTDLAGPEKTAELAGMLHDSIRLKLRPLGDATLVFPAHGSGSVCGSGIADREDFTLGHERRVNPALTLPREEFVAFKARERIARPPYFSLMRRLNSEGGIPLEDDGVFRSLVPADFEREAARGLVIDTRSPDAFAAGHVPGSYSIWLGGLSVFAGWVASEASPIFLVLDRPSDFETALTRLRRVGCDRVTGTLAGGFPAWREAGLAVRTSGLLTPREVKELRDRGGRVPILDVRRLSEWERGHIAGAIPIYAGELEALLDSKAPGLDRSEPVIATCSVGNRTSLAVSMLERLGFTRAINMIGGMSAWEALGYPMACPATEQEDGRKRAA